MIHRKIDLYEACGVPREGCSKGYLHSYVPQEYTEIQNPVRPAVIVIPGGGYGFWSEREGEPVALRFLSRGYAVFLLEYDLKTPYPKLLIQGCMAVKYLREHSKEYNLDGAHVCVAGFSAGGHFAGMLATLYGEPEICSALSASPEELRPDAAILSYAVITMGAYTHGGTRDYITGGDRGLFEKLSLENAVTKQSAPAFIWHTETDDLVPVENAFLMANAYRKCGVPFELHVFGRGPHGLSVADGEVMGGSDSYLDIAEWFNLADRWLKHRGFLLRTK